MNSFCNQSRSLGCRGAAAKNHIGEVRLEMLGDVLYDAEDLVDELSTEALRQHAQVQNDLWDKVLGFFSVAPFYVTVAFRMKSIRDRLNDVSKCRRDFPGGGLHEKKKKQWGIITSMSHSRRLEEEKLIRGQ